LIFADSDTGNLVASQVLASTGAAITGGYTLYNELKDPSIRFEFDPINAVDTFYCRGYKDGYFSASKFRRTAAITGGCFAGAASAAGLLYIILSITGMLSFFAM
jgi:hypothetical protein